MKLEICNTNKLKLYSDEHQRIGVGDEMRCHREERAVCIFTVTGLQNVDNCWKHIYNDFQFVGGWMLKWKCTKYSEFSPGIRCYTVVK